ALGQVGDVVVAFAESGGQRLDMGRIGHVVHEEAVHLGDDKRGRRGLLHDNAQHILAAQVAVVAQKGFGAVVVLPRPKHEVIVAIIAPAGEGAGRFFHVGFGVVAAAQREKLHHFAGEVFVGMLFAILLVIKKLQHGRLAAHGQQQVR
nr:hypothetical protein [Tanacetum cinerariifolium]